jgi:hypothetical protein
MVVEAGTVVYRLDFRYCLLTLSYYFLYDYCYYSLHMTSMAAHYLPTTCPLLRAI